MLRDCLVSHSGLRTGLFGPSTPAFSARSAATNLKSRPPLDQKSLVLACGLTYQTVSKLFIFATKSNRIDRLVHRLSRFERLQGFFGPLGVVLKDDETNVVDICPAHKLGQKISPNGIDERPNAGRFQEIPGERGLPFVGKRSDYDGLFRHSRVLYTETAVS